MALVNIEQLATELGKTLDLYSEEVAEAMKKAVDKTATETKREIKSNTDFVNRTGHYVAHFAVKTIAETRWSKSKVWYVKAPEYRLTHLLEHGHIKRNYKGNTRAFPHISKGEEYAEKRIVELIEELINAI